MNYSFKKKYNKNFLVLEQFDSDLFSEDYKIKMLKRNSIDGLLDMQIYIEDNVPSFYYDITSKQSLFSYFYDNKLSSRHIYCILTGLYNTLLNLNRFLLDYDHLLMIPQCIFFDKELKNVSFCYCPNAKNDFFLSLKEFFSYLLTITDHNDDTAVLLAYSLHQETLNESFNISSLISIADKYKAEAPNTNIYGSLRTDTIEKQSGNLQDLNITNQPACLQAANIPEQTDSLQATNILKQPDILFKENYTYSNKFLIKNSIIYVATALLFFANIVLKISGIYSSQLFFIILLLLLMFIVFYTGNLLKEAPLYRIYKAEETEPEHNEPASFPDSSSIKIIDTTVKTHENTDSSDNETVLLCINPDISVKHLVYTGIDFSSEATIDTFPFTIGKSPHNNLIINHSAISRTHARIIYENDEFFLEDLNSSNGTKINDNIISAYTPAKIVSGDIITFAHLTYIFQ